MLILAFDTAERNFTAAVVDDDGPIGSVNLADELAKLPEGPHTPGASALLIPMIRQALADANVTPADVDLIAMSNGPGQFTGVRIGTATARLLGYLLDVPVIATNSLHVCASTMAIKRSAREGQRIHAIINGQRRQLFAACWEVDGAGATQEIQAPRLFDQTDWLASVGEKDWVTGSGLSLVRDRLVEQMPAASLASAESCGCDAISIARHARTLFDAGRRDDVWSLQPIYFRPSAAEEAAKS